MEPGVYAEHLDFLGKAITVESEQGPAVTVLDGGFLGRLVVFRSGEGRGAILRGFTLRRGATNDLEGGAIGVFNSSPSILDNVITDSRAEGGGGIGVGFGSPLIQGNTLVMNRAGGFGGGAISLRGASEAEIVGNRITGNVADYAGGIELFGAGHPQIRDNIIADNVSNHDGGGMELVNQSDADLIQNLIVGNTAARGGGVRWLVPLGKKGPLLVNNTIADNNGSIGSAIHADGFDQNAVLVNNIVAAPRRETALFCGTFDTSPPNMRFNNVFSALGAAYGGSCADQTHLNGNISADPRFVSPAQDDYHLSEDSALIDAGDNAAPQRPSLDLDGMERVVDGDRDNLAQVDLGVYEFVSRNASPVAVCRDVTVDAGADCRAGADVDGGSHDPEDDPITRTQSPPGPYDLGMTTVTLTVTDDRGAADSCAATVMVRDTTPPTLSLQVDPPSLWPPNHEMVPVKVTWQTGDACDPNPVVTLNLATSSEPDDVPGIGDGDTTGDIEGAEPGSAVRNPSLRAERAGAGSGRVYQLIYGVTDGSGNTARAVAVVTVPHDQGSGPEPLLMHLEPGGTPDVVRLYWAGIAETVGYDLIAGELSQAQVENHRLWLGAVRVLARGTTRTSWTEDPGGPMPAPGTAFFYLIQARTQDGGIGYGTESAPWPRIPSSCGGGCP
ncbi:MAG TPA: right-handed parallel beta-helix repeat-containing protein [Candidatus Polarisedimenticolia bacterium]|nr:right-handed parallel beta-helix repeat-containing protein [Candidatus Polarisedimenticolia bacterium]